MFGCKCVGDGVGVVGVPCCVVLLSLCCGELCFVQLCRIVLCCVVLCCVLCCVVVALCCRCDMMSLVLCVVFRVC